MKIINAFDNENRVGFCSDPVFLLLVVVDALLCFLYLLTPHLLTQLAKLSNVVVEAEDAGDEQEGLGYPRAESQRARSDAQSGIFSVLTQRHRVSRSFLLLIL